MSVARRIRNVNILYLISMVLVVTVGSAMQMRSIGWGLMGTEVLLILLPSLLYIRYVDRSGVETLRIRWPGYRAVVAGLLIGAGLQFVSIVLDSLAGMAFGYSIVASPEYYPTTVGQAFLLFAAMAIAAPICEEFMFRGVIQPAYEAYGSRYGVIACSLLFIFFHLRFQGLIALIPIAFTLGYVVWRTNSLLTGCVVHFSFNALNTVIVIVSSWWQQHLVAWILPAAALGVVGSIIGFRLLASEPERDTESRPSDSDSFHARRRPRFSSLWPLLIVAAIYGYAAKEEVAMFGNLSSGAQPVLALQRENVEAPSSWVYEIQDPLGRPIGEAEYRLEKVGDRYTLNWRAWHDAFRTAVGPNSLYQSDAVEISGGAEWSVDTMSLLSLRVQMGDHSWAVEQEGGNLFFSVHDAEGDHWRLTAAGDILVPGEWPWRLSYLPFNLGYRAEVQLAWPMKWNHAIQRSEPALEGTQVKVSRGEVVNTSSGRVAAWRVELGGRHVVWYAAQPPHPVIRYHDGVVIYVLTEQGSLK